MSAVEQFAPQTMPKTPLEYLHQGVFWRSQDGTIRPLAAMHTRHLTNLLPWLYRHAHEFVALEYAEWCEASLTLAGDASLDIVNGELDRLTQADPEEWIRGKPLTKAVVAELARREGM